MKMIHVQRIVGVVGLAVVLLVLPALAQKANAANDVKLIFQDNYPTTHPRLGLTTVGQWLDTVEKSSGGKITFERHWAEEPVPAKEALSGLARGVIDGLVAFPPYYSGSVAIADICAMPKNFMRPEDVYDLWFNSNLGKLIDEVYQKRAHVKVLFPIVFAPENFQISKKANKLKSFSDFKGMKIRAGGGMLMQTIKAIGAVPVFTHGGEYYTAMQRGVIDAGLMTTYSLEAYKMWEVADEVVNPPIMNNCFVLVYMNLDRWKSLSPSMQNVLIDSAKKLYPQWIAEMRKSDARITKLAKDHGVEFYVLPKTEQKKMWQATEKVWDLYVESCTKQGFGKQAQEIRSIVNKRFESE